MISAIEALEKVEHIISQGFFKRILSRPWKYFIAYLAREEPIMFPGGAYKVVDTIMGLKMWVCLPAGQDIYLWGAKTHDSELRLTKYLLQHGSDCSAFFDIGAHFGYYSVVVSQVSTDVEIYSFEPTKDTYKVLFNSVMNIDRIKHFQLAVSDTSGKTTFNQGNVRYSEYNSLLANNDEHRETAEVNAITLNDFCKSENVLPDLIKIDVEGAEHLVLKGGMEMILSKKSRLIIEISERNIAFLLPVLGDLSESGYKMHQINAAGEPIILDSLEAHIAGLSGDSDNILLQH